MNGEIEITFFNVFIVTTTILILTVVILGAFTLIKGMLLGLI